MKKHMLWIVPLVLYVFIMLLDATTAYFHRTWFNIKHVLLFGIIVYVLLITLYGVFKFFNKHYIKKQVIKISLLVFLSAIAIATTITLSNLQIAFIEKYEVPYITQMTHYDQYGNVIYKTLLGTNSELENVIMTSDSLSFTVSENIEGILTESFLEGASITKIYYKADVTVESKVDITYQKNYINSFTYTMYKIIERTESDEINGYMFKEEMRVDHEHDNQVIITYTTQEYELDMTEIGEFPNFDTITPVITQHISTLQTVEEMFQGVATGNETQTIELKEVTYNDNDDRIENVFAIGQLETTNEPLITLDFYNEGIYLGETSNFYFDYDKISIKNSQEKRLYAGVDMTYDIRTLEFIDMPIGFFKEEEIYSGASLFSSFEADIQTFGDYNYKITNKMVKINNELYIKDDDYYSKVVTKDYGLVIEKYETTEFSFDNFHDDSTDETPLDQWITGKFITIRPVDILLQAYDYKNVVQTPGILSNYHFYQHNYLIEYLFIGD